jgi:hypothetical protein
MRESSVRQAIQVVVLGFALATSLAARSVTIQEQPSAAAPSVQQPAASSQSQAPNETASQKAVSQVTSRKSEVVAPPSLGELARRLKAEEAKHPSAPAMVFTNDNLPTADSGLSIIGPPAGSEGGSGPAASEESAPVEQGSEAARTRMAELKQRLDTHERELAVLQQKLGQIQVQYYPTPSEGLHQQFSRSDIDKLKAAIAAKQEQVEADQQAIAALESQVSSEGGNVKELRAAPPATPLEAGKPDLSGVAPGSKEYWARRFKAARAAMAQAEKQQQLCQDELSLLQSQQAHDIGTPSATAANAQIAEKQSELESAQAVTEQAKKNLADLEQEFEASGAPADWAKPDSSSEAAPPQ